MENIKDLEDCALFVMAGNNANQTINETKEYNIGDTVYVNDVDQVITNDNSDPTADDITNETPFVVVDTGDDGTIKLQKKDIDDSPVYETPAENIDVAIGEPSLTSDDPSFNSDNSASDLENPSFPDDSMSNDDSDLNDSNSENSSGEELKNMDIVPQESLSLNEISNLVFKNQIIAESRSKKKKTPPFFDKKKSDSDSDADSDSDSKSKSKKKKRPFWLKKKSKSNKEKLEEAKQYGFSK